MYIVTGGCGFIGSWVARELQSRGMGPILIVDNLDGEKWRNLIGIRALIQEIDGKPEVKSQFRPKAVLHLGGISSTSEKDVNKLYENNVKTTCAWSNFARDLGARFIYASSAAVYGDGPFSDQAPTEDLRPLNAYGWSKQQADLLVDYGVGLRFFNAYGPGEAHKGEQRSYVTRCLDTPSPVPLFEGTADNGRDWVWVGDCARLCVDLIDKNCSGALNVGTSESRLFRSVVSLWGKDARVARPPPEGYQRNTKADLAKFRTVFPDFKFLTLEEGVDKYRSMLLAQ